MRAVLEHVVGQDAAAGFLVLAGDVVAQKKPAPDIYLLALEQLGIRPSDAVVVEDSANGLDAAHAAGITCVVTVNDYTRNEDFGTAAMVVSSLGEPDGERTQVLADASGVPVTTASRSQRWRHSCLDGDQPADVNQGREITCPQRFPTSSALSG